MTWSLPNTLTVIRLLAAPGLALAYLFLPYPWADWTAFVLFVGASITDWLDGHLARIWRQESRFGAMLDPIADKAMVVIALMVVAVLTGMTFWVVFPATFILFREVFVSGLREFLGTTAGLLKVTKLAKWKTTAQMVAIAVLILYGLLAGAPAPAGRPAPGLPPLAWAAWSLGVALLWVAAVLTVVTGADYFRKALPFLREDRT